MPFKRGISGNQNGRPIGVPNKVTTDLRLWVTNFVEENKQQIQADWLTLDPKDRILIFEKFLKHILPGLQSVQSENCNNKEPIRVEIIRNPRLPEHSQ